MTATAENGRVIRTTANAEMIHAARMAAAADSGGTIQTAAAADNGGRIRIIAAADNGLLPRRETQIPEGCFDRSALKAGFLLLRKYSDGYFIVRKRRISHVHL